MQLRSPGTDLSGVDKPSQDFAAFEYIVPGNPAAVNSGVRSAVSARRVVFDFDMSEPNLPHLPV